MTSDDPVHGPYVTALELCDHLASLEELNGGQRVHTIVHGYIFGFDGVDLAERDRETKRVRE